MCLADDIISNETGSTFCIKRLLNDGVPISLVYCVVLQYYIPTVFHGTVHRV